MDTPFSAMGASMSNIFLLYTGQSIASTFFITSAMFAGVSLYGYTTKADLTRMGSFMMMGVWGLLLAMVVNWFFQSPAIAFAISILGVVIFVGLTAYDTQRIKSDYLAYAYAEPIARRIGTQGTLIATKLTAFLLLCIGVQITWNGVRGLANELLASPAAAGDPATTSPGAPAKTP